MTTTTAPTYTYWPITHGVSGFPAPGHGIGGAHAIALDIAAHLAAGGYELITATYAEFGYRPHVPQRGWTIAYRLRTPRGTAHEVTFRHAVDHAIQVRDEWSVDVDGHTTPVEPGNTSRPPHQRIADAIHRRITTADR